MLEPFSACANAHFYMLPAAGNLFLSRVVFFAFIKLISSDGKCSQLSTCETCAGIEDGSVSCRWCLETSQCVPSKYQCHPWRTVLHFINCPIRNLPTTYNDTFNRNEISYYILAANRVSADSPVGAPMSCLLKIGGNIVIHEEIVVPTTIEKRSIGVLIGINHDLRHIFIGFRSTNNLFQLISQHFVYTMGWMTDFPLGGKMVAIYNQIYDDVLKMGFDASLDRAVAQFPFYSLLVTGHSLGGAMSTVFSLHIALKYPGKQIRLYSSSAPRSGDETFVRLLREKLFEEFRIVRDGDFVPDFPLRVSQTIDTAHHNSFEVYYPNHMTTDNYKICDQPETEYCIKGSWWKQPAHHAFLFDQDFFNMEGLGYCS